MKNYFILFILFTTLFALSCTKDEPTFPKNQNTIGNFIFLNKGIVVESLNSSGTHLMGFKFWTKKRGKINQIGIFSGAIGTYTVYIRDSASNTLLFQDTVYQKSLKYWSFRDIKPFTIETQKKYYFYTQNIPVNPINAVKKSNPANAMIKFPMVINSITIDYPIFSIDGKAINKPDTSGIYGLVDFTFREDRYE